MGPRANGRMEAGGGMNPSTPARRNAERTRAVPSFRRNLEWEPTWYQLRRWVTMGARLGLMALAVPVVVGRRLRFCLPPIFALQLGISEMGCRRRRWGHSVERRGKAHNLSRKHCVALGGAGCTICDVVWMDSLIGQGTFTTRPSLISECRFQCTPWHGRYGCTGMNMIASTGSNHRPSLITGQ